MNETFIMPNHRLYNIMTSSTKITFKMLNGHVSLPVRTKRCRLHVILQRNQFFGTWELLQFLPAHFPFPGGFPVADPGFICLRRNKVLKQMKEKQVEECAVFVHGRQ